MKPKRRKILYVITKSNWGGAQRYVFDLATSLPPDRFQPSVVLGGTGPLKEKLDAAGIKTISLPYLARDIRVLQDLRSFFGLLRIFLRERPDIVHLNSSKIGGLGSLAARISNIGEIVFTAHGWAFNENRSALSKTLVKFIARLTVLWSHKTIAVSRAVKEQLGGAWGLQPKIHVVYNGPTSVAYLNRDEARNALMSRSPILAKRIQEEPPKYWIGTISELHYIKGLDVVLEAIRKLPDSLRKEIVFVVMGEGEERKRLEHQIGKLQLRDNVFLIGHTPDAPRYLKALDIFTLTSRSEAFAFAVLEAGLAGIPVVATRVGGIPEIISSPQDGVLIPPENSSETAHALEQLIGSPRQRQSLSENLQAHIARSFSKTRMVAETVELYKQ